MSEEHNHRHHFFGHHKNEEATPPPPTAGHAYPSNMAQSAYGTTVTQTTDHAVKTGTEEGHHKKQEKAHKHKEHIGEALGAAAGAYALYEHFEAKKDSEHAGGHKTKEKIAAAVAVGAGGYAIHEHHQKKKQEEPEGHKKHHHLF
ncbi:hypothetical protein KP509_31G046000 [Ceratopteris richardii]|uniref:Uncharacterized protein n=1 Tax=Ceratopteris richardii TaxID=49495 RepID=A0A8T2QZE3_CERRI|nr:hypothetical protein KP509_31G046000 [Ceratopteris richardii]